MHLFLTGEKQVGKSTIIRKFLAGSDLAVDGFVTFWEQGSGGAQHLYISSFGTDLPAEEKHLIASKDEQQRLLPEDVIKAFNVHGRRILDNSGKRDLIIMDEIGFFESQAADFQKAVMRHLSGDVPVIGVIKPMQIEFLDEIRAHPKVETRLVTQENRDSVLKLIIEEGWPG